MTPRRKHSAPDPEPVAGARQLAPVESHPDDEPTDPVAPARDLAPTFPTEADVERISAQLVDDDPSLAHVSHHVFARALAPALTAEAERLSRATHRERQLVHTIVAPVFPTEDHETQLRAAVPMITTDDAKAVLNAGHAAFLASVAAGEPITQVPDDEEAA